MARTNYLIGRGELLTEPLRPPPMKPNKVHPYDLSTARDRLLPSIHELADVARSLSDEFTPDGVMVGKFTLHPAYLAKSYFPARLLRAADLELVGTKYVEVSPEVRTVSKEGPLAASDLLVAGTKQAFMHLPGFVESLVAESREAEQFAEFEAIGFYPAAEKIRTAIKPVWSDVFEIGLHVPGAGLVENPRSSFEEYAKSLGFEVSTGVAFDAQGLWFVPVIGPQARLEELASFTLVRVVRSMPQLRQLPEARPTRNIGQATRLPSGGAIDPGVRVAILDGGVSPTGPLSPWINAQVDMNRDAADHPDYVDHGTAVTSAFLFGAISPGGIVPRPFAEVDHFRVLDDSTAQDDPLELYKTLAHVEEVLLTRSYEFVNLSLGPELPIEDNEVHAWTAVIDDLLSDGATLMTVAAGNNGNLDRLSGNARIQVPADSVNALAVGATAGTDLDWHRTSYSAIGPGRRPGVIKPDIVAHGGDATDYFHVVGSGSALSIQPLTGTSFSSPLALRSGVAVRSIMGDDISVLAIKALMINAAQRRKSDEPVEIGWGKLPDDIWTIISCPDGVARVIYQGELRPGKFLRAAVPLPLAPLEGTVTLRATFCFATGVDPQTPDAYTTSGLQVTFRPDLGRFDKGSTTPRSRTFFSPSEFATEENLRADLGKWETVLHASDRMRGSTLVNPAFDIHYIARDEGANTSRDEPMRYALVLTLEAPKHANLFESVLQAHAGILTRLEPQVAVPVNV